MSNFFKNRLQVHFKNLARYLKYVFNDFFVIALMFFVGALGLVYANFLKGLSPNLWWEKVVIILALVVGLQICGLATLVKKPDQIFVAPKEYDLKKYFRAALEYSFLMATFFQAVFIFILMPFIMISLNWSISKIIILFVLIIILKWMILTNHLGDLYLNFPKNNWQKGTINLIVPMICLIIAVYFNLFVGLIMAIIFAICLQMLFNRLTKLIDWKYVVNSEERRMSVIYRFLSLFKDVPEIKPKSKRRGWLRPLFKLIKKNQANTFTNLYLITLIRDGEISSLFFRLTVIGFLVIIFVKNAIMSVFIYDLFIYLVGFQLIPAYKVFDDNVFVHIYPISNQQRIDNFRSVVKTLLFIESLVLMIGMFFSKISLSFIGLALIIGLFEIYYLTGPYLKNKFKNEMEF